jgi:hypothetical protein
VTLYGECTRALTFLNGPQERAGSSGEREREREREREGEREREREEERERETADGGAHICTSLLIGVVTQCTRALILKTIARWR